MKWTDKLLMKWRLKSMKADENILDMIQKQMKVEKIDECQHERLNQLIKKDIWYQCKKCKMVFCLFEAPGWRKEQIPILIDNLEKSLKIKRKKD